MAEASLLKAARALDQDGPETVASKLSRFWTALAATEAGASPGPGACHFHAAEAIALRWLLKNMTGSSTPEAETLRRWPLTWRILACILRRIPLFSLAKALADRRFVAVLQQTARDLATPISLPETTTTDEPSPGSRKRKRAQQGPAAKEAPLGDDLASLRTPLQCLVSAAALFAALRALLARLDEEDDAASDADDEGGRPATLSYEHMGAEHIKTLFNTPATDAMALLVPLLRIANMALARGVADTKSTEDAEGTEDTEDTLDAEDAEDAEEEVPLDGQATWVSVFATLWELHAQGPTDAVEAATHLAPFGFAMLSRLQTSTKTPSEATETQRCWTAALRRFLTNNVVLPARAAFLNRNDMQILAISVGDPSLGGADSSAIDTAVLRSSVLLDLALRVPPPLLSAAAPRDNAFWLRTVLDKILEPFLEADAAQQQGAPEMDPRTRNAALANLLELASRHGLAPSAKSLSQIAGRCALGTKGSRLKKGKKGRRGGGAEEEAPAPEDGAGTTPDTAAAVDWRLLAAVARCDADTFLVPPRVPPQKQPKATEDQKNGGESDHGTNLLDSALGRLSAFPAVASGVDGGLADREHAAQFLVSLARAFSKARNLSGFVTRWYQSLVAVTTTAGGGGSAALNPWFHPDLSAAVSGALQPSLTKEQLMAVLDQILNESDGDKDGDDDIKRRAVVVARLVVLDALSAGISLEEYEDAVQTRMVDTVLGSDDLDLGPDMSVSAMRWRLIRRTLAWVGASDAERLWAAVRVALAGNEGKDKSGAEKKPAKARKASKGTTALSPVSSFHESAFEALVCSFSFWMALKLSGPAEDDARAATWSLFERFSEALAGLASDAGEAEDLRQEVSRRIAAYRDGAAVPTTAGRAGQTLFTTKTAAAATYLAWMLCGSSRFVDEMVKSSSEPSRFLDALLAWQTAASTSKPSLALSLSSVSSDFVSASLLANVTSLQNSTVTDTIAERYVQQLQEGTAPRDALLGLLRLPTHLLVRPLREKIVSLLLPPAAAAAIEQTKPAAASVEETVLVLDLLTRVLLRDRASSGSAGLDRLRPLGEAVHAAMATAPLPSALGLLDRLQRLATVVTCRAAATGSGIADNSWFLSSASSSDTPVELQLVFLRAQVAAVSSGGSTDDAQEQLASLIVKQIRRHLEAEEAQGSDAAKDVIMTGTADADAPAGNRRPGTAVPPVPVLLALDAALADSDLDIGAHLRQQKQFDSVVNKAGVLADRLCSLDEPVAWKWKAFYVRYAAVAPSQEVHFRGLFEPQRQHTTTTMRLPAFATTASVFLDSDLLRAYLAAATTRDSNPEALLAYVEDLIAALPLQQTQTASSVAPLLAIQYLLDRFLTAPPSAGPHGSRHGAGAGRGLAAVHSQLVQRLPRARSRVECRLVAQTLRTLLLDDKVAAAAMGQWNVDATLSAVAVLVGGDTTTATGTYDDACRLVEAVLKRHRVRLEGRFHLLVGTLQALLARLVAGHQEALHRTGGSGGTKRKRRAGDDAAVDTDADATASPADWTPQAKRFSRLLELVCEPSTAAVTRMATGGGPGSGHGQQLLHSATDTAKRSAGQHMYLVLMTYIKLQIDGAVVLRSVREALDPGLFSVLTITSDETRRLLNDAVDASGRALFRDLYRRWLQFGKWKGV